MFSHAVKFSVVPRNRTRRWRTAALPTLFVGAALLLAGMAPAQDDPVQVLATVGMIADVAENVGGECVEVTQLMGPGVDPHLYQASARDVRSFRDAELILYAGYSLEGQLGEVLDRFSEQRPTRAVAPASIEPAELITTQDVYGIDPHLWMDPSLWSRIAPTIADAVAELAPECAEAMRANAEAYARELQALHDWAATSLATVPEEQRLMVTAHDAFAYFGRAYAVEVAGIQGISTESEAGVADIREMARLVAERDVPAVFIETTINPRTIQAVIDAAENLGHEVRIGAELYSDAMGEPGTAAGTYVGMIYQNTVNVTRELGGTPPPLPQELGAWAERWDLPHDGE